MQTAKARKKSSVTPITRGPSPSSSPPSSILSTADKLKLIREQKGNHLNSLKRPPAYIPASADPLSNRPSTPTERRTITNADIQEQIGKTPNVSKAWTKQPSAKKKRFPVSQSIATLPKPKTKFGRGLKAFKSLVHYWHPFTEDQLDKVVVHVYRKWPVIDRLLTGKSLSSIMRFEKSDEPGTSAKCPFSLDHPDQELLHLLGSGEYKFMLTELGVPHSLMTVEVTVNDDKYPPQLDYRELVKTHPLNQSFIDGLKRRGIKLPWETEKEAEEKEEEDMGTASSAMGAMASTVTALAQKLGEGSSKGNSLDAQAIASGMNIVQEASRMGMEIVQQGIAANSEKTDPIAMLRAVTELTGAKKGDDAMTLELMRQNAALVLQMQSIQQESSKEIRGMMREFMASQQATAAAIPPPKSELEMLREAVEKRKLMDELSGNTGSRRKKDDDDEDDKPAKPSTLETVIQSAPQIIGGLATIFTMGANMFHNYTLMRAGAPLANTNHQGDVQAHHATPGLPQPAQQPNPAQSQQPGLQAPPQQMGADGQPTQTEDPEMLALFAAQKMLTEIQSVLLAHYYGEGTDGASFAHWIITQGTGANPTKEGRKVYDGMFEAGKDKLLLLLRSHAVWNEIGQTPMKTNQFVDTFLAYDAITAKNAESESEDDEDDNKPAN